MITKPTLDKLDRLRDEYVKNPVLLFITMWGIAHIGHFLRKGSVIDPFVWISLFLALLLIAKPQSGKRMAALTSIQLIYLFKEMPITDNHLYIMGFVNAGLLIAAVGSLRRESDYFELLNQSVAYISITFLIAYFAAAFSKLNSGFFDANYSCAVTMFYDSASLITDNTFLPAAMESLLPYIVAVTELSIPLLLIFRKTRYAGIIVLVLFHIGISLSPTATALDFTIALFALSIPFLAKEAKNSVIFTFYSLIRRVILFFTSSKYSYPFAVFLLLLFVKAASRLIFVGIDLYWVLMAPFALLFGGILIQAVGPGYGLKKKESSFQSLNVVHYSLIILLLLNAVSPYLGLKTAGTFTMYSNLQTENSSSNHFLIDRYSDSMPMDDMVEIVSSDNSRLNGFIREGQWITFHELRRILSESPQSNVNYIRQGEVFDYNPSRSHTSPTRKHLITHKLIGHRAYNPENAVCLW